MTLTVDPNATSGGSIQYTIKDGYGGVTTGSVVVNLVQVTGYMVQRQWADGSWNPENGQLWSTDTLRWTATLSSIPPLSISSVDWKEAEWDLRDDPGAYSSFTPISDSLGPTIGNPGTGIWAVRPEVVFSGNNVQSGFVATLDNPPQEIVAHIYSVTWFGIDPGDGKTNLSNDNPQEMGDGWRIFPDKNTFDGPAHMEIEFLVKVLPVKAGIEIPVYLIDADDPTAVDEDPTPGPDTPSETEDNFGNATGFPDDNIVSTVVIAGAAYGRGTFEVSPNPGDNYRIVAAARPEDRAGIRPLAPDSKGRLYHDIPSNGNQYHEPGEPILDESTPFAAHSVAVSPLLTVWRRLNVEVDSMGGPDQGQQVNWDAEDPAVTDVANPDTSGMVGAFEQAFIEVDIVADTATTTYNESDLPFHLQEDPGFDGQPGFDGETDLETYAQTHRQSQESKWYWSAYVLGIYEFGDGLVLERGNYDGDADNDPNGERALPGYNLMDEPEAAVIPMEVIRDLAADEGMNEASLLQHVVVHEVGHQFGLVHNWDSLHVMNAPRNAFEEANILNSPTMFREDDLEAIRDDVPTDENDGP